MRTFKRSNQLFVTLFLFAFCLIATVSSFGHTLPLDLRFLLLISYIALAIVVLVIPSDFNYTIKSVNDFIIFEMSRNDHRRINKSFTILSKNWHYMVLDDGFSRIRVGYNKQVVAFLKEIRD